MKKKNYVKRILAIVLAAVMVASGLPDMGRSVSAAEYQTGKGQGVVSTIDDPQTLTRPMDTYGNSTFNAGKILVGKSVTDGKNDVDGTAESLNLSQEIWKMTDKNAAVWTPAEGNFLVTVSQSSQMYGVSSKIPVPLDVVFIIDTSGSMDESAGAGKDRADAVMAAANSAIKTLLEINKDNRIGVVAFSGSNNSSNTTTVLSELAHYNTDQDHLTINWQGNLSGNNGSRNPRSGGTNIQAGIAAGAQMLMGADNLQVTYGDRTVTRIPILILLSDGAPTYSSDAKDWTKPDGSQNGRGSDSRGVDPGEGFLPMLTASYYKNAITNKYYGESSTANERAFFYTIGVGLGTITKNNNRYSASPVAALANLTMNPSQWLDVSMDDTEIDDAIRTAWDNYQNKRNFTIDVGKYSNSSKTYSFKYHATSNNEEYNIDPSVTSLKYNDQYWLASSTEEINRAFSEVVIEIQKRAITVPTLTDINLGQNFSGYVNFTDPIGEYMEVKEFKGVTGDGYLYDGKRLAKLAAEYDPNWANTGTYTEEQRTLFAALEQALFDRIKVSNEAGDKDATMDQVRQILNVVTMKSTESPIVVSDAGNAEGRIFDYDTYGGQLFYQDDTKYGNSFTWFGKLHYLDKDVVVGTADYNDEFNIGFIGVAPKNADSVNDWLKQAEQEPASDAGKLLKKAKDAGANVIVRSYFMYGADADDSTDMLHYQLRVITSLSEPHQQYVSIKVPASLLAMQSVLIDDTNPAKMVAHYDDMIPTRVTYEVGLRSDITPENIWSIVDSKYINEYGNMNADGSINFYTNDFKRYDNAVDAGGHTGAEHDHAYTNATFDVHDSNSFYRYEKDTQLLDASGKPVRTLVTGQTYYYERVYYEWTPNASTPGEATATQRSALIPVVMTEGWDQDDKIVNVNGYWYVKEGTYTAFTVTRGDDQLKTDNETVTAHVISHPQRTNHSGDSHYTVWLGNNGRLTYVGVPSKTVYAYDDNGELITEKTVENKTVVANIDGQMVKVGDKLNYQIQATNNNEDPAQIQITDTVPTGTALAGSKIQHKVGNGSWTNSVEGTNYTYDAAKGILTWTFSNVAPGQTVYVRFDVIITEDAVVAGKVDNEGQITVGNNTHSTNVTTNHVTGKRVADENGEAFENSDGVTVGEVIRYQIAYHNDTDKVATITITDEIPEGTVFYRANHTESLTKYKDTAASDANKIAASDTTTPVKMLQWVMQNVQPGTGGVVGFEVMVDASVEEDLQIENQGKIQIGDNDPVITNETITRVETGMLKLTKEVVSSTNVGPFSLVLTENTGKLNGTYTMTHHGAGLSTDGTTPQVTFVNGVANLSIYANETLTIEGLPAGITMNVTEPNPGGGFTASITNNGYVVIPVTDQNAQKQEMAEVLITNAYDTEDAQLTIQGTKQFINNDVYSQTKTFWFELEELAIGQDGNPIINSGTSSQAVDQLASLAMTAAGNGSHKGTFAFTEMVFTEPTVKYYLLSEINNKLNGVTYDADKYVLQITVVDNGEGQLVPTVKYIPLPDSGTVTANDFAEVQAIAPDANSTKYTLGDLKSNFTFENSFTPVYTTLTLYGFKTLTNKTMTDDQFSFELKELLANDVIGGVKATGQSKADGSIVFTTITYKQAGTYTYVLKETTPGANITAGGEKYKIEVNVVDEDGVLSKTVKVYARSQDKWVENPGAGDLVETKYTGNSAATAPLQFTNTYDPGTTYIQLKGSKTLMGSEMTAGQFTFDVKRDGAHVVYGTNAAADGGKASLITFDAIPVTLNDLGSDKTETYTYTIHEVKGTNLDISYSADVYTVTVTVTYHDATGWNITYDYPDDTATDGGVRFINSASQKITPTVQKVIQSTGLIPTQLTFGFQAFKATNAMDGNTVIDDGYEIGALVATATSAGITNENLSEDGTTATVNAVFSEIVFRRPGIYQYWVVETNAGSEVHGVKYSNNRYLMVVNVSLDETGNLQAATTYYLWDNTVDITTITPQTYLGFTSSAEPSFTNEYKAIGTATLTAKKEILGTNNLDTVTYDFTLTEMPSDATYGTVHTGTSDANGKITFDALTFEYKGFTNHQKVLIYEMKEVSGNRADTVYDTAARYVRITIEHTDGESAGSGSIEVIKVETSNAYGGTYTQVWAKGNGVDSTAAIDTGVVFTNTVYVKGSTTLPVTKILQGRDIADGEFTFVLRNERTNVTEDVVTVTAASMNEATATSSATLNIEISAEEGPGTYHFLLTERNTAKPGVTYDQSVYRVTVNATNNNGQLEVAIASIKKIQNKDGSLIAESDQTEMMVDGVIPAVDFTNIYAPASTSYVLAGATKVMDGRDMGADEFDFVIYKKEGGSVADPVATGSHGPATDGNAAPILFTPIPLESAGIHTFIVEELPVTAAGVTATGRKYELQIQVTDNTSTGQLEVKPENVKYKQIASTQEEAAEYAPYTGTGIDFINQYDPADIVLKLNATKKVIGRDMRDAEFTFYVYQTSKAYTNDQGAPVVDTERELVARGTNVAGNAGEEEVFQFSGIPYTTQSDAGTYIYEIVENDPDGISEGTDREADGLTEDKNKYLVEVVVSYVDAKLSITSIKYKLENAAEYAEYNENETGLHFVNVYEPAPTTATIQAVKKLEYMTLTEGMFTFTLTETDRPSDAETAAVVTKKNAANGLIDFGEITYRVAGDYTYEIREDVQSFGTSDKANPNIIYDETVHTVIVHVVDNGYGALSATVDYDVPTTEEVETIPVENMPVFTNVNDPVELPVKIRDAFDISKIVLNASTGASYVNLSEFESFVFEAKDVQGRVVAKGYSQEDGSIWFDYDLDGDEDADDKGIVFDAPGVYRYSISEVEATNPAITEDPVTWWIEIEVEKDAEGALKVKKHFILGYVVNGTFHTQTSQTATTIAFTNTYDAKDAELTLTGTKVMTGHRTDVTKGEFTFNLIEYVEVEGLENPDAVIVASATNDDQGVITFDKLTYDQAGVYDYELVEVYSTAPGVKYDPTVYQIQVTVYEKTDEATGNYLGELVVDYTIKNKATGENADAVFTNVYTDNVVVPITVTKQLTGRDLKAEEFTFVINDANGLLLAIGKNDAAGNVVFDKEIKLAIGTHQLSISEQVGTDENVTYDTSTYQVMVEVTSEDGDLVYSVTYPEGGIVFKNTYEKPEEPAPEPEPTPEPPVPPAANPDTGDTANMGLWLSVLAASVMMILQVIHDKKRRSGF